MIGRGVGGVKITPAEVIVILQNSVRPLTDFLMAWSGGGHGGQRRNGGQS